MPFIGIGNKQKKIKNKMEIKKINNAFWHVPRIKWFVYSVMRISVPTETLSSFTSSLQLRAIENETKSRNKKPKGIKFNYLSRYFSKEKKSRDL